MILARKRATARLAATAIATGLVAAGALATAGTAAAEENPHNGGATATLGGFVDNASGPIFVTHDGERDRYAGGLFSLQADDGGTLQTYCIDFTTATAPSARYREVGWNESRLHNNPDAGRIQWILQNSYPVINDLDALAEQAGVESLSIAEAAAGTQAAIWEFSDGVEAEPESGNAAALTDWLTENAEEAEEPTASLTLTPNQVSGQPGGRLGPITVDTTADAVSVTPDAAAVEQGVTLTDGAGNVITEDTPVTDGTELFFDVPEGAEDGSASLTATATSQVPIGRAFTGIDVRTQTMILAGSSESSVSAGASANWAAPGTPAVAVDAEEICAEGGVEVTVSNQGDVPFEFELNGETVEVAPGTEEPILVPVENGQEYDITIANPIEGEEDFNFTGVLDCAPGGGEAPTPIDEDNEPAPASTGGGDTDEPDLAATGSSSNVGMITGVAVALLVVGGAGIFFMRRRSASAGSES
ncbi:LPXTG cell wall anchor domain-containing protein [Streptomyces sp. 8K308]|uniref:thioester domain-containing protein n=1 Tax=Streptomyces sp. 8K308 TaxID=2530388 RepID=UPI001048A13C|nr:thioester domain-containing protein [Streptomyces sp. 8K308]TDC23583.1 LPXTG cell wall anchor domain-containing protein [Streptomyces sp. 8K308]